MKTTMTLAAAVLLTAIGLSGWRGGLSAQAPKTQWDGVYSPAQAKRGEDLYALVCSGCHAADLSGGGSGQDVGPELIGRDFTAAWNNKSLGDLFDLIFRSMPQNQPGSVTRQEVADVVAFMLLKNDVPPGAAELPTDSGVLATIKFVSTKPEGR